MPTRLILAAALALFVLVAPVWTDRATAEEPTPTTTATPTSRPMRFFNVRLQTKALSTSAGPVQDVQGTVTARAGGGIDGVLVRAFSTDWQAFESTRDGGKFKFALTAGSYTVQLVDVVAQEIRLTVDGKSDLQVEFYEVESLPITSTPTVSALDSPTATATATASPTGTETPSPTTTPIPLPTTADEVVTINPTPTPTPIVLALPFEIELNPLPWLDALITGLVVGGAVIVLGLAVAVVRR